MKIKSDQDRSLIAFLMEQLERLPAIHVQRMFGGYGMYSDELFFAIIDEGCVYFKTDEVTKTRYEARDLPPFKPGENYKPFKYHLVPVDVIEDAELLTEWAREALKVSQKDFEKKQARKLLKNKAQKK